MCVDDFDFVVGEFAPVSESMKSQIIRILTEIFLSHFSLRLVLQHIIIYY